jgi:arabinogalactan endo-1,4-beta-galactosidase
MLLKFMLFVITVGCLYACKQPIVVVEDPSVKASDDFLRGIDASFLPEMERLGVILYNQTNVAEDMLTTAKQAGCNVVRIRLWKKPVGEISSLPEVKAFAQKVKAKGLKVWLTVHYSDTWADPAHQIMPSDWATLTLPALKDSVYQYTQHVMQQVKPDIVQVGNEINGGFLFPKGKIEQMEDFRALLASGIKAVRDNNTQTKIMLHFAGLEGSAWFYDQMKPLDYDYIGLSYYPLWHGKDLLSLGQTIQNLQNTYKKEVIVAETSYAFTLDWNDWTNNIIGNQNQLLDAFPATPTGQKDYLQKIKQLIKENKGKGFCYWGAEWIAYKGSQSTEGSSWENQTLYDFNNKALPIWEAFAE